MKALSASDLVDLSIDISWGKGGITHLDHYFAHGVNCWRDVFPKTPLKYLFEQDSQSPLSMKLKPGEVVGSFDSKKIVSLPWSKLNGNSHTPFHEGRFYPQGLLSGVPGVFKENRIPFRCARVNSKGFIADMNHPMAGIASTLNLGIVSQSKKPEERGGACVDWLERAFSGPGMQSRYHDIPTDFFSKDTFDRRNTDPDSLFYRTDRFVHHIDNKARQNLSDIYKKLLCPGERILDLMASWESHMPLDLSFHAVHGIGLNPNELKNNPRLSSFHVQDMNTDGRLDFKDHSFDAVVCSLSIEYLVHPISAFKEVARVLKPGGRFVVSFSNRWFPEKVIRVWEDLHDFERMGLIVEYFRQSGRFKSISTTSMRGYPRSMDDPYFPKLRLSDPVYVVVGQTATD